MAGRPDRPVSVGLAWGVKLLWWQATAGDSLESRGSSPETATGLGFIGKVRLLEKPHSGENYLTKEMVHKVGRKHAAKLRLIALALGAVVPLVISLAVFAAGLPAAVLAPGLHFAVGWAVC